MKSRIALFFVAIRFTAVALGLIAATAYSTSSASTPHPGGDILLKGITGSTVSGTAPYSPKQTCSTSYCHMTIKSNNGVGNIYEYGIGTAVKVQTGSSYTVAYPEHGVSAGYHFQQGKNLGWGADQKNYYGLPGFTSSPGMYGKY